MSKFFDVLTGEFVLRFMPNGGIAVLIRSVVVSILFYAFALLLKVGTDEIDKAICFNKHLKLSINETIPWFGAIFGGVYAGFYARFSSQWSYLADLYNQQMAASLTLDEDQLASENFAAWQAAFVEDAVAMHLATKVGFSVAVYELIKNDEIKKILIEQHHFGKTRVERLEKDLKKICDRK